MADVRWMGEGDREVPLPDGQFVLPHGEWVDLPYDAARALAKQDGFELRAAVKAAKTRKQTPAEKAEPVETPAVTGEEV